MHYDAPAEPKAFTHRSGRTARAGESGAVVTMTTPAALNDVLAGQNVGARVLFASPGQDGGPAGRACSVVAISRTIRGAFSSLRCFRVLTLGGKRYAHALSTSMRRARILPALVMGPRLT